MCGILGITKLMDQQKFKRALDTLTHRGPDGYGIENIDDRIMLGHRRLSIIDLSIKAAQPMFDRSGKFCVVFNGEIYNFLEIRDELKTKGYDFISGSDTEVLLKAYIEWGEDCVLKFNGMWAFAIWNKQKNELFLSRDRFGKKPLFYAFIEDKFIFASEMKAIYPYLKEVRPSSDFNWIKSNMHAYEYTDKCLIDGIKRFPSGHNGYLRNNTLELKRYWNTIEHLVKPAKKYSDQVVEFRELFFNACKIRMRSDVPMGTALSGGVDSSSVISAMANIKSIDYGKKDWQHAFVASFPGTPLDETEFATMVAENINIKSNIITINPLNYWDRLEEYFYKFEEFAATSIIPMVATYDVIKKNGISVTLDGHGPDELFTGYEHFKESLWDNKFNIIKTMDILNTYKQTFEYHSSEQYKYNGKYLIYYNYMKNKINSILKNANKNHEYDSHPNFSQLDSYGKFLYNFFHRNIALQLRDYDRISMINSVESRMPFMDHRIVAYVMSLPSYSKNGKGYTKRLIRDAMSEYIPKEVIYKKSKVGFLSPLVNWMQNELKEWFSDIVHQKGFLESNLIFNNTRLQTRAMNIINKKENSLQEAQRVWMGISIYLCGKSILREYN